VIIAAFCLHWTMFDSFDVYDSCHVILVRYLIRQSRDNCQNNDREAKNHLFRILQKICSIQFLELYDQTGQSLSVLTFLAVGKWH